MCLFNVRLERPFSTFPLTLALKISFDNLLFTFSLNGLTIETFSVLPFQVRHVHGSGLDERSVSVVEHSAVPAVLLQGPQGGCQRSHASAGEEWFVSILYIK